jgi:hypothetical protein
VVREPGGGVKVTFPPIPRISDHGSEILLLGLIAGGIISFLLITTLHDKKPDVAACLVVLVGIVGAIKERWTQRSVDRMGASLANAPAATPPTPPIDQPVPEGEPR